MRKYSITTPDELRSLCIRKNWFTCGSNRQYEKLFHMNEVLAPIEQIATVIWLCSDDDQHCRRDILAELENARDEYIETLAEEHIAAGERAADEIYCGYFD